MVLVSQWFCSLRALKGMKYKSVLVLFLKIAQLWRTLSWQLDLLGHILSENVYFSYTWEIVTRSIQSIASRKAYGLHILEKNTLLTKSQYSYHYDISLIYSCWVTFGFNMYRKYLWQIRRSGQRNTNKYPWLKSPKGALCYPNPQYLTYFFTLRCAALPDIYPLTQMLSADNMPNCLNFEFWIFQQRLVVVAPELFCGGKMIFLAVKL